MLFAHPYSTKDERKEALGHHHHQRLDHENALKHIYTQNELNTERLFSPIPALIEQRMRKQGLAIIKDLKTTTTTLLFITKAFLY